MGFVARLLQQPERGRSTRQAQWLGAPPEVQIFLALRDGNERQA